MCSASQLKTVTGSPCVDAGDPDPQYDETCAAPTLGTSRNDIGAHGGPGACLWGLGWETTFLNFCETSPNSVDPVGARIVATGTSSYSANDLVLNAGPVGAGVPAIFYYGPNELSGAILNDGFRCVGGQTFRLPVVFASPAGDLVYAPDNTTLVPGGDFFPGCTWKFQAWYRDTLGPGGNGSNLSDGVSITFGP